MAATRCVEEPLRWWVAELAFRLAGLVEWWVLVAGRFVVDVGVDVFLVVSLAAEVVERFFAFADFLSVAACTDAAAAAVAGAGVEVVALDVACAAWWGLLAPHALTMNASRAASATRRAQRVMRPVTKRLGQGLIGGGDIRLLLRTTGSES
ncbi:MAG: hypothetical protein JO152_04965 [Mycobacteriaceae bacterium]|nr:hypothetical protein [Mycobacteriaceae bacterium]